MSSSVPEDAGNVSAACPHCQQSISAPGHDLTVLVRCPRCRAELRLSEIIAVSTPMPAEVIPGTSRKSDPEDEPFDAERTLTVDPLPRPKPLPPPPPSARGAALSKLSMDATVADPSVFGPFPDPPAPAAAVPSLTQPSALHKGPDATAYQAPVIVDVDSTAPMSRPPQIALTPVPPEPKLVPLPAPPPVAVSASAAPEAPSQHALRARFAHLDARRKKTQLQFVVAVVVSLTLSVGVDAILATGPFFRTLASLFTVSMAALWVLIVAASADPGPDGAWSLGKQGLANLLSAWRGISADRARAKELDAGARSALVGRTLTAIAAPLAVGFELLRFLQLALYGFLGVGSGSAIVFNVLAAIAAAAALAGLVIATSRRAKSAGP
ncbi:MAG: hypothetical protein U0414_04145 [Polyangiaceae bacterium]